MFSYSKSSIVFVCLNQVSKTDAKSLGELYVNIGDIAAFGVAGGAWAKHTLVCMSIFFPHHPGLVFVLDKLNQLQPTEKQP